MDVHERIARRQSAHNGRGVVVDRSHLSPVVHRSTPIGRGSVLEGCLDALEPIFDGQLPPPVAIVGPPGSGTSAVVTALFAGLNDRLGRPSRTVGTTTRAGGGESVTWFVYVDARRVGSPFAFYRTLLSGLSTDSVPTSGVGTDDLRGRLRAQLERHGRRAIVAIDHHDEPETLSYDRALGLLEPITEHVSTVAVGQREPDGWSDETVAFSSYRQHELVDVLTDRVSTGLTAGTFGHDRIRDLAQWADGNAHDALAVLFGATILASEATANRIEAEHVERAKADTPADCVHVGRPLALPETRQQVLLDLVSFEPTDRPIREIAVELADGSSLTSGTVKRFLYELADRGILERVPLESDGSGRRPSAVAPRFPTIAFRSLASGSVGNRR